MAIKANASRTYAAEYQPLFDAVLHAARASEMKVVQAEPELGRITLTSSVSLASWGENVVILLAQAAPGSIQVTVESKLKFGLVDWGRNDKNLNKLFLAIDQELASPSTTPSGWHPDPMGRHEHRWWDGAIWTDQVADAGVQSVDPPG